MDTHEEEASGGGKQTSLVSLAAASLSELARPDVSRPTAERDEVELISAAQEEHTRRSGRSKLKRKQREALADRLLAMGAATPGAAFMDRLSRKLAQYGVELPTVTIEFRDLSVTTDAIVGSAGIPTVGNVPSKVVRSLLGNKGAVTELGILKGISGVIKPGRTTLLLGPPSCGKSTFLKVLAGRLKSGDNGLRVTGDVKYNGRTAQEFMPECTTALVDQHDNHIANLTVYETLSFALICQAGYGRPDFDLPKALAAAKRRRYEATSTQGKDHQQQPHDRVHAVATGSNGAGSSGASCGSSDSTGSGSSPMGNGHQSTSKQAAGATAGGAAAAADVDDPVSERELEDLVEEMWGSGVKLDVTSRMLGLAHCKDTFVGDAMLRGLSGGEKKRLTTAEMVVGPRRVMLMDEISTGLDSATLYSIITFFCTLTHGLQLTTVISLLQPPPEVFQLFDDVMMMTDGHIVYHGPVQEAVPFFDSLGFRCPARKDVPSYLLEITTPAGQRQYACDELKAAHGMIPGSLATVSGANKQLLLPIAQLRASFLERTPTGRQLVHDLAHPFEPSKGHPAALQHHKYALTPLQNIKVATARQMKLVMRDKVLLRGRMMQVIVIALLVGSLFFKIEKTAATARDYFGASFMITLFMAFGGFPQLAIVMQTKGVWLKHRDNYFYPSYAHGIAMAASQLPLSLLEGLLFSVIVYFMIGYYTAPGYFFTFYITLVTASLNMSAIFRLLAVIARSPVQANTAGGMSLLILILTSGFAIVRDDIPPYWIWAYYISPFAYAIRNIVINELTAPAWGRPALYAPGQTVGESALLSFSFFTERYWIWAGVGYMIGMYLLLSGVMIIALDRIVPRREQATVPDEAAVQRARAAADERRRELRLVQEQMSARLQQQQQELQLTTSLRARYGPMAAAAKSAVGVANGQNGTTGAIAANGNVNGRHSLALASIGETAPGHVVVDTSVLSATHGATANQDASPVVAAPATITGNSSLTLPLFSRSVAAAAGVSDADLMAFTPTAFAPAAAVAPAAGAATAGYDGAATAAPTTAATSAQLPAAGVAAASLAPSLERVATAVDGAVDSRPHAASVAPAALTDASATASPERLVATSPAESGAALEATPAVVPLPAEGAATAADGAATAANSDVAATAANSDVGPAPAAAEGVAAAGRNPFASLSRAGSAAEPNPLASLSRVGSAADSNPFTSLSRAHSAAQPAHVSAPLSRDGGATANQADVPQLSQTATSAVVDPVLHATAVVAPLPAIDAASANNVGSAATAPTAAGGAAEVPPAYAVYDNELFGAESSPFARLPPTAALPAPLFATAEPPSAAADQHVVPPALNATAGGTAGADAATAAPHAATAAKFSHLKSMGPSVPGGALMDLQSSLPFEPITLVFKDLRYFVPNPAYKKPGLLSRKPRKPMAETGVVATTNLKGDVEAGTLAPEVPERLELLKGITGFAEPGVLTALMGGSGAGKTTLMDVICGRKTVGEITGEITVNGHPKVQRTWSRAVGYVEQQDIHTPAQTVEEALWFSARLRLPPSVTDKEVRAYVEEVMDIVDLMDIMYSLVGTSGEDGLSTEQRKRLTIAVELVANPSCVLMDEPTSGLDARAASLVMRAVRNVARNGRTVMVTIHQPSIEIFEAFDMMLLLQRGGRTTYFGPLGYHSSELISFLEAVPGTHKLVPGFNPATWMLEVTGGSMATLVQQNDTNWPGVYARSALAAQVLALADELVAELRERHSPLHVTSTYAQPFRRQLRELCSKYWLAYWRSPAYNFTRTLVTLITSFIYGSTYYRVGTISGTASITNVQNVMGILFSSTNFLGMTNFISVMPIVGVERVVFYRERGASPYNPFAYGLALALVELPYLFLQAIIFVPVVYWMIGFQPSAEKFFFYFIMFTETIAFYTIFGVTLVYITPSQVIAQVVGASLNLIFNIINGFVITYPRIPIYWKWLNRVAPTTYVLYGLGASQLGNVDNPLVFAGQTTTVANFLNTEFGYDYDFRWWCVLIMFAYIAFFRVGSILALRYWNFLKR